ncbi:MAG TPA: Zn-binding domain-containing protein, partial [Candidatus Lustribacter sp.]|nr:Zn-binding domain-containing protein [Candidatus Lustribacter sp.]
QRHAQRLVGMPVSAVTADGSPRASLTMGLWEPALKGPNDGPPRRRSVIAETAELLADLVAADVQTVAFARSRAGVEVVAAMARERLERAHPAAVSRVAAYRGGYLPEDRRDLERRLRDRSILGLAATNALELGIDVRGLDAVLLAGWPGTRASLWQQAGRAGRAGSAALAVFVAADDPLDTYLVHHPEVLFDRPVEATVCDPGNPHILAPHLAAAAAEVPITEADETYFGPAMVPLLDALAGAEILRRRPTGWYWARADRPTAHLTLRGAGEVVQIVEASTGRVIGTVDEVAAHSQVHPGAVHLHQGQPFVVTDLDLVDRIALVTPGDPGWSTQSRSVSAFDIVTPEAEQAWGSVGCFFGTVAVRTQVTSFLRRRPTGEVLGEHPLDLPIRTLDTKAVWWTFPTGVLEAAGLAAPDIPGAAHAAEHAAIGMLPLVASADRWDIGGVSTALHPDTGLPTILIYDGYPGGAGFAERGFGAAPAWLAATRDAIAACSCSRGCPSCVQSPKCGNGNEPLDKAGALTILHVALAASVGSIA